MRHKDSGQDSYCHQHPGECQCVSLHADDRHYAGIEASEIGVLFCLEVSVPQICHGDSVWNLRFLFAPLEAEVKKILIIMFGAPLAQMTTIFSLELDPDNVVPATISSISIIISVIVMPILIILLV